MPISSLLYFRMFRTLTSKLWQLYNIIFDIICQGLVRGPPGLSSPENGSMRSSVCWSCFPPCWAFWPCFRRLPHRRAEGIPGTCLAQECGRQYRIIGAGSLGNAGLALIRDLENQSCLYSRFLFVLSVKVRKLTQTNRKRRNGPPLPCLGSTSETRTEGLTSCGG